MLFANNISTVSLENPLKFINSFSLVYLMCAIGEA